jgi:hypothetical protein
VQFLCQSALPGTTATGNVDGDDDSAPVAGGGGDFLRKVGGAFLAVVSVPLRTNHHRHLLCYVAMMSNDVAKHMCG